MTDWKEKMEELLKVAGIIVAEWYMYTKKSKENLEDELRYLTKRDDLLDQSIRSLEKENKSLKKQITALEKKGSKSTKPTKRKKQNGK